MALHFLPKVFFFLLREVGLGGGGGMVEKRLWGLTGEKIQGTAFLVVKPDSLLVRPHQEKAKCCNKARERKREKAEERESENNTAAAAAAAAQRQRRRPPTI